MVRSCWTLCIYRRKSVKDSMAVRLLQFRTVVVDVPNCRDRKAHYDRVDVSFDCLKSSVYQADQTIESLSAGRTIG